jgi:hypothetical protein
MKTSPEKALGIMQLDTRFPRIPGDVSHPDSYEFPIIVQVVSGANFKKAEQADNPEILALFLEAAMELEAQGVFAITTSCGFLAAYQREIASRVRVPVFLSSLLQIPLVRAITMGRVGIVTARAATFTVEHLRAAGVSPDVPTAVAGLEDKPMFRACILNNGTEIDPDRIKAEVIETAGSLLEHHSDIGAFVFECHNLAPYAPAVVETFGKPVFDIITLAHFVHDGVFKRKFLPRS